METLLFYYLYCYLCISYVGAFPGFPYNPWFLCLNTMLPWFLRAVTHVVHDGGGAGRGGYIGWSGGTLGLVHVFKRACSLTWQPYFCLRIPAWILFPRGTGEPSSANKLWIGPHNGDCNSTVYSPPYLQKGFFPFLWHYLTQLQEYNQVLPP